MFTITAQNGIGSGTLTAKTNGPSGTMTKAATLTVGPVDVDKLTLSPATVTGGATVTGTLTLNGPTPSGGLCLTTSASGNTRPATSTLVVSAGAKTATFSVLTFLTSAPTNVTLMSTVAGITRTAVLAVNPGLSGLKTAHPTVQGGHYVTATVTLSDPSASDVTVALASSNSSVLSYPAGDTVPAGSITATFTLTAAKVTVNVLVHVTATLGLTKTDIVSAQCWYTCYRAEGRPMTPIILTQDSGSAVRLMPLPQSKPRPQIGSARDVILYIAPDFAVPPS